MKDIGIFILFHNLAEQLTACLQLNIVKERHLRLSFEYGAVPAHADYAAITAFCVFMLFIDPVKTDCQRTGQLSRYISDRRDLYIVRIADPRYV